jgi:hypothetical protein
LWCTLGFCALLLASAGSAGAGDDPYGSTTTTVGGTGAEATCSLDVSEGAPGTPVRATVGDAEVGSTVRILFGGDEVGRGVVEGSGDAGSVTIDFVVPDKPEGSYQITAVGATFTVTCESAAGVEFAVLAASAGAGGGTLPKTGVVVGALVLIALVLLVAGRMLLTGEKARNRRFAART